MTERDGARAILVDGAIIAAVHAALCIGVRAAGFDHVSDDDFSRVTIAQAFAHAPKLDPSGTSWLPFPFWILGSALAVLGRSLAIARGASIALASAAAALPYVALRRAGVSRGRALVGAAFAIGTPWCVWLGAATVPESFTATLTATGAIGLVTHETRAPEGRAVPVAQERSGVRSAALFSGAIVAATLSRYEAWPVAAVLAVVLAVRALRADHARARRAAIVATLLCAAGPLAWMAWNAHAHDGPLHFFRRVSSYKRAIGEGSTDPVAALLLYPRLFVATRPEIAIPFAFVLVPALRDRELRRRWAAPLLCVAAQIAFLAYGNARDGAPAHHAERALVGSWVLAALFVADAGLVVLRALVIDRHGMLARAGAACIAVAWVVSTARGCSPPGTGPSDDRRDAVAHGLALRAAGVKHLFVTPCAYEHFALIAAYGAPENVDVRPRAVAADGKCPGVAMK